MTAQAPWGAAEMPMNERTIKSTQDRFEFAVAQYSEHLDRLENKLRMILPIGYGNTPNGPTSIPSETSPMSNIIRSLEEKNQRLHTMIDSIDL